jgi:zinc protease
MKIVARGLLAASLLLSGVQAAAAQSAEDVVERYLAAVGGRASLEKLTSRAVTGTITLTTPVGEVSGAIEIFNATPGKERTLISLDLTAVGAEMMTVDQRFDGATGYVIDTLQGNREVTGLELENMRNQANTFPDPFLAYKQAGMSVTLGGREKVGDRDAYVLIAVPKSGSTVQTYIDAESFLLLKSVSMAEAPQVGQFEQTTEFLDYRDVGGFKVPFQIKATSSVQSLSIVITSVEHNKALDASMFARPAN